MSERDAFGNPIEPGGGLSTGISGLEVGDPLRAPEPAPAPDAAPTVAAPTGPTLTSTWDPSAYTRPEPARARGGFDWLDKAVGLFFVALFVVPFAVGGWFAYSAWHDTAKPAINVIKDVQRSLTPTVAEPGEGPASDKPSGDKRPAGPPRGLASRSLLKPARLGRVLASARRDPGGRLRLLRLAPDRADLQLTRRNGGLSMLQLRYDGGRSIVTTPAAPAGNKPLVFSRIDRRAPQRLVTAAAHRLGRSTKSIDYVVLIDVLGAPRWSAYFTGGAAFQGDAHGKIVQRIS